jgi:hypothetical protein
MILCQLNTHVHAHFHSLKGSSAVPMNMNDWQNHQKALKDQARKSKTEAAEGLRSHRGGVTDDDAKRAAMRAEERSKAQDAERLLHSYRGKSTGETKARPVRQEPTHPPPVNASGVHISPRGEVDSLQIVPGSVSAMAANFTSLEVAPSEGTSVSRELPMPATATADATANASVEELPAPEPYAEQTHSVESTEEKKMETESAPENVKPTETTETETENIPDSPLEVQGEQVEPVDVSPEPVMLSMDAPQEPLMAMDEPQEPVMVMDAPQEPVMAMDAPQEPVMVMDAPQEPVMTMDAPQEPLMAMDAPQEPLMAMDEPVMLPAATMATADALLEAQDEPLKGHPTVVRLDVLFSFGLVTGKKEPSFANYLVATEEIVNETLKKNAELQEHVTYDAMYGPFVQECNVDGKYSTDSTLY